MEAEVGLSKRRYSLSNHIIAHLSDNFYRTKSWVTCTVSCAVSVDQCGIPSYLPHSLS